MGCRAAYIQVSLSWGGETSGAWPGTARLAAMHAGGGVELGARGRSLAVVELGHSVDELRA